MPARRPSSVPAVEDALAARLRARTGLAGAVVQLGLPARVPPESERIYLVGVAENQRTPYVEQGPRRETYVIPVLVEVHIRSGDDRSQVRARFWAIVEEIEAELAADPELANLADTSSVEEIAEMNILPTTDGWIAKGLLHIRVNAIV